MIPERHERNLREKRWERVLMGYGRLHPWLQWALIPWLFPAYILSYFPIITPALCGVAAIFLAYLKWGYLEDQLTWGMIGWMATSPLWLFVVLGYPLLVWTAVGTVPLAIVVFCRQWREARPFCLRDPEPDVAEESRAGLLTTLREGMGLTQDNVRVILAISETNERRLKPLLKICGCSFVVAFIGIGVARILFGYYNEGVNAIVLLLCFATLSPVLFLFDPLGSPRLRCRHCNRALAGNGLERMMESNACPTCSGPAPLAEGPGAYRSLPN
jgi:hypothetical protein